MRTKLVILCWLASVVLLMWPVKITDDGGSLACGGALMAFVEGQRAEPGQFPPIDRVCGDQAYSYIAVAAGLVVGAPLLAALGWRGRRRRRKLLKVAQRRGERAVREAATRRQETPDER